MLSAREIDYAVERFRLRYEYERKMLKLEKKFKKLFKSAPTTTNNK